MNTYSVDLQHNFAHNRECRHLAKLGTWVYRNGTPRMHKSREAYSILIEEQCCNAGTKKCPFSYPSSMNNRYAFPNLERVESLDSDSVELGSMHAKPDDTGRWHGRLISADFSKLSHHEQNATFLEP